MKRLAQKALFQIEKWDSRVLTPHRHDVTTQKRIKASINTLSILLVRRLFFVITPDEKLVWHWFGRLGNFTAYFLAKGRIMDKMSHQ